MGDKQTTSERARRMLALVAHLSRDRTIPLDSLAAMLGVSVAEVATDLELLSMCGTDPYDPHCLVPVYVEDGTAHVWDDLPALDRRVRLTAAETRALAAALQAAGRAANDPLVTRLLAATSDVDPADLERTVRSATAPVAEAYAALALALQEGEAVRIAYQSTGRDETTERVVEPLALLNERSTWYVEAYCRSACALRTFRVDRIRHAQSTGEKFPPHTFAPSGVVLPTDDLPVARIRLAAGEDVPDREWPGVEVIETDETGTLVELPYAGTDWIARQVSSYLGRAEVLEPADVRSAVASLAAREA